MKSISLKTGILEIPNSTKLEELTGFSSRMNLKRGFLFVSKVLGKHIPTKPSIMQNNFKELANLVENKDDLGETLVIGFAETATALGQGVFEALNLKNATYIQTTRYNTSKKRLIEFMEEHSHAPSHILYKPEISINSIKSIILVDDEISTGKSVLNIVAELKEVFPDVKKYQVLSMLNWSSIKSDEIEFSALFTGNFNFKKNGYTVPKNLISETKNPKNLDEIIPDNFGRFGVNKKLYFDFKSMLENIAIPKTVLVLGTGEFMYPPFLLAQYLENLNIDVKFQATTRSPINIDGMIESKISFQDNYFENIDNFLYNIKSKEYEKILICYETKMVNKDFKLRIILEKLGFFIEEIYF